MPYSASPRQNLLLAALPTPDFVRLHPHLELIWMPVGKTLHGPGDRLHYVYFPTTCIVSLFCLLEDGGGADVAVIGNDGVIGIALFMGGESMPNNAVVLSAGCAYRLHRKFIKDELDRSGGRRSGVFNQLLLHYTQALLTQMAQTSVCNQHHSLARRLCRLLLLSIERSPSNELLMTQKMIAGMLGVRREGVTEAAMKLQMDGLIEYKRGHITILNRAGLEARACECYKVIRKEYDRLLPRRQLLRNARLLIDA